MAKKTTNSEDFPARLRAAGLRSTPARVAVLKHLAAVPGQHSHADVVTALAHEPFDRATIYRVLVDLADAGILARADLGDRVWRFALEHHAAEHPHFVCTDCGAVQCLEGISLALPARAPASKTPRAVRDRKISIQVKGRCDDCS